MSENRTQSDTFGGFLENDLCYAVKSKREIKKGLGYAMRRKREIKKVLAYTVKTTAKQEKSLCYVIKLTEEQERTKVKKRMFLEYFAKSMGIVRLACQKIDVSRSTFYDWKAKDKEFTEALLTVEAQRNDEVEDRLFQRIREGSGADIRYYLTCRNSKYKPRSVQEVITGDRTYEDLVDEQKKRIAEAQKIYDDKHKQPKTAGPNEQGSDRKHVENKDQEGSANSIPVQRSPEVLLETKDTPKPDTESEAKGVK